MDTSSLKYAILYPDGQIKYDTDIEILGLCEIISGSFNPLHDGHIAIRDRANLYKRGYPFFELSICNKDKGTIIAEALDERLNQFRWRFPVIISNAATFLEKSVLFPKSRYHIGIDTFDRLFRDYGYGITGINSDFVVYPRQGRKFRRENWPNLYNCTAGEFDDGIEWEVSSTQLRRQQQEQKREQEKVSHLIGYCPKCNGWCKC